MFDFRGYHAFLKAHLNYQMCWRAELRSQGYTTVVSHLCPVDATYLVWPRRKKQVRISAKLNINIEEPIELQSGLDEWEVQEGHPSMQTSSRISSTILVRTSARRRYSEWQGMFQQTTRPEIRVQNKIYTTAGRCTVSTVDLMVLFWIRRRYISKSRSMAGFLSARWRLKRWMGVTTGL